MFFKKHLIQLTAMLQVNLKKPRCLAVTYFHRLTSYTEALGANNWTIRKLFLYNSFYLILRGLFWGNLIGIGILLIQKYFGIIKLNPESYYVNEAPVSINVFYILLLNFGTILICLFVLLIPSYIITKISPSKSIRFE